MSKRVKKQKTTLQKLNFWKAWKVGLTASEFAMPAIPFGVILGVNWNNWVGASASNGWTVGMGFGMLITSVIASVIGIWKKDEIVSSKVSGIFYVSIVMLIIGFSFKMLASVFNEFGDMFVYVGLSVIGSGGVAQVNKSYVSNKVQFYQQLVTDNGLDKKSSQAIEDEAQAKKEGEDARKKVDLL